MSSPTQSPKPIKGSWEALLAQAAQLDNNRNEEALPIYQKLITRLRKMPKAKLKDRNERLQQVLETACFNAGSLRNSLGRFEEALKDFEVLHEIVDEENKHHIVDVQASTLQMMGRYDDAIALIRSQPRPDDDPLRQQTQEFGFNVGARRFEAASTNIAKIQEIIETDEQYNFQGAEESASAYARLYSMSSILALELGEWEKGIENFSKAQAHNSALLDDGKYLLYSNLVNRGQPELALPIIAEERVRPRRLFWQGLAHYYMGETDQAAEIWKSSSAVELNEEEVDAYVDIILTHYYLGDEQQIGLELVLRLLHELENPAWQIIYFGAIGWAMRNNKTNTIINLEHTIDDYRREGIGEKLPWTMWTVARDLLSKEMQTVVRAYFDEQELNHYFGDK